MDIPPISHIIKRLKDLYLEKCRGELVRPVASNGRGGNLLQKCKPLHKFSVQTLSNDLKPFCTAMTRLRIGTPSLNINTGRHHRLH